jgi:hypothetical protein
MEHGGPGDTAVHQTQLQVTASLLSRGMDPEDVFDLVIEATQEIAPPNWNWDREERAVRGMIESFLKKNPEVAKRIERRQRAPREVTDASPPAPNGASGSVDEQSASTTRNDGEPAWIDLTEPGAGGPVVSLAAQHPASRRRSRRTPTSSLAGGCSRRSPGAASR